MLVTGLSDWQDRAEEKSKREDKGYKPKENVVRPPKKFSEMTGEEIMMWSNQAGGGKI